MKRKRELQTFKCIYCGRFMSYKELEEKTAIVSMRMEWDYGREDVCEVEESYHVRCQEKYEKDVKAYIDELEKIS